MTTATAEKPEKEKKKKEKRWYKLKAGTHVTFETVPDETGIGRITRMQKVIRSNDPKGNIIASEENLAAQEPARWEEVTVPPKEEDEEEAPAEMPAPTPALNPTGATVILPTDREERRKFLETQMKALEEEEASAEGKGEGPSAEEAAEHQRTLMGKSDTADAALEEWEKKQSEAGKEGKKHKGKKAEGAE